MKDKTDFQPFEEASITEAKGEAAIRAVFEQPSSSVEIKEVENEQARPVAVVASRPLLPKVFAKGSKEEKGKAVRNVHERVETTLQDDTSVLENRSTCKDVGQQAQVKRSSEGPDRLVSMKPLVLGYLEPDEGVVKPFTRTPDSKKVASPKKTSSAAMQIVECEAVTAGFLPEQSDAWDTFDKVEHIEEKPSDAPDTALAVSTATSVSQRAQKISTTEGFLPPQHPGRPHPCTRAAI